MASGEQYTQIWGLGGCLRSERIDSRETWELRMSGRIEKKTQDANEPT